MKKKDKGSLAEQWEEYRNKNEALTRLKLEYDYEENKLLGKKELIVEALTFWKFVQLNMAYEDMGVKREFLSNFIEERNTLVNVVAMIEFLPTSVWRKVLWRYNIDFMSFESFLRRLSVSQIRNIRENYQDLFEKNVVPRAFSRPNRFIGKITVENLLSEKVYHHEKYKSKGSWSHNLLGLEFGFNAYVNGVTDDTKVVEFSPLRFLSVKNHVDDFIVNQENGKYWWLYKTAHSSYGWMWNKKIQLKTHICPGFWYTLLIHFLFWVISPAAFTGLMSMFAAKGFSGTSWLYIVPMGIPSIVTPLWLIMAGFRLSFRRIFTEERRELIMRRARSVFSWSKKHEKITILPVKIAGILALVVGMLGVLCLAAQKIYEYLYPAFGMEGMVVFGLTLPSYISYKIYYFFRHNRLPRFGEYPRYLAIPILFMMAWLGGTFFLMYHETLWTAILWAVGIMEIGWSLALKMIMDFLGILRDFALEIGIIAFVAAIPLVLMAAMLLLEKLVDEKKYDKLFNAILKYTGYSLIALLGFAVILTITTTFQFGLYLNIKVVIAHVLTFSLFAVTYYMAYKYNPESNRLNKTVSWANMGNNKVLGWHLFKNSWVKALDDEAVGEVLLRAKGILFDAFGYENPRAYPIVFPCMTKEILDKLDKCKKRLRGLSGDIALRAIKYIVRDGYDAKKAISIATSYVNAEKNRVKIVMIALKTVFFLPLFVWLILKSIVKLFLFIWEFIWEWVITIPRLYKLFNDRCPFVTKTKVLSME